MDKSVNEEEIKDCSKEQVKEENNNKIDIEPTLKLYVDKFFKMTTFYRESFKNKRS